MNRRGFVGTAGLALAGLSHPFTRQVSLNSASVSDYRSLFPRLEDEIFLNAAGGTPLSTFAQAGLERYMQYWQLGPSDNRRAYVNEMLTSVPALFGDLVGAEADEIALVHCTKQGEQIVLDSLHPWADGGNVVTNDFHFSGSLHSYLGHQQQGRDVRIVRNTNWQLSADEMIAAMDDNTRLVALTLASNINGRIEDAKAIADAAHSRGAYVYLDIIQAAGAYPIDLKALDADFAACSGYKWLFGPHGTGFLYVRSDLQGRILDDRLFPGHTRPNYAPWTSIPDANQPAFSFSPPETAQRYQPGHISYLGYCALYEGLKFIQEVSVETLQQHAVALNQRLLAQLDQDRYPCISNDHETMPIVTFWRGDQNPEQALRNANITVALPTHLIRVSPSIYNTEADIDALAKTLNNA